MNVLRSLARTLWKALDLTPRSAGGEARATAPNRVALATRLRDGFERTYRSAFAAPRQGDGFDPGVRRPPVDLTGGVQRAVIEVDEPGPAPVVAPSDFVASLDDLALLLANGPGPEPAPASPDTRPPEAAPPAPLAELADVALAAPFEEPADVTPPAPLVEPANVALPAPLPQPADLALAAPLAPPASAMLPPLPEEGLLQLADFEPVVDAFDPGAPVDNGLLTLAAFEPVVDAFEPAAPRATTQHTVELLMPAPRPVEAQPKAVEHFSTLELFDVVDQLTSAEEPPKE